jgi:hypothetical protein
MSRLNNETYFAEGFEVPDISDFLASLQDSVHLSLNIKTLKIYLVNLGRGGQKSVFVELKWLLCLHRALPTIKNGVLLERIYDVLSKMEVPTVSEKIDEFILDGIVRPYIHLLAKLCLIGMQELDTDNSQPFDKENRPSNHRHSL